MESMRGLTDGGDELMLHCGIGPAFLSTCSILLLWLYIIGTCMNT